MIRTSEDDVLGTVLIVDDDFAVRLLARETLEQAGCIVFDNCDGVGVLLQCEELEPDLIILDVFLPQLDGFSICQEIRALPGAKNIPILMMTGLDDVSSIHHAYQAGATDFITKPFNWPILAYRVRYLLRNSLMFQSLDRSQRSLNYAQKIAGLGSWEWDITTDKLEWSEAVYRIFHIDPVGFDGTYHAFLNSVHPLDKEVVNAALETAITYRKPYSIDHQILLPNGEERYVHTEAEVRYDKSGRPCQLSGTVQDITERRNDEERIRRLAFYDSLTGLPNRVFFKENLERALVRAERRQCRVATMFLDLDRFKWINDTLGHAVGDQLLQEFAARLSATLRSSDLVARANLSDASHALARLGGDEFTVILDDLDQAQEAALVARRILEAVRKPFVLEGQEVSLTVSIGISIYPDDGEDIVTLIKNADTAMYYAKERGKNTFQFYTHAMTQSACLHLMLETQLRRALERDEFTLAYQPIVDLATGKINRLEALLRWHNQELGDVPPATFIPLAEETGVIKAIDAWVLRQALNQLKRWQEAGHGELRIAVNLSGQALVHQNLADRVAALLEETGVAAHSLELELTEGVLMRNSSAPLESLKRLKELGLTLAIDDFGTSHSSLSALRRFHLDTLKIDRSFITDLPGDQDSAAIVRALVGLAGNMRMAVVAVGIETAEQLAFLRELGCGLLQGFLFSRPLTPLEVAELLARGPMVPPDIAT
ncbi:two-component system response regulator [Geomonas limicola]|uniref:Two-component system response regulator n=1 Tax=Geomonas limicola TaxID=2740186 RepID=A0A6V8N3M1_9BACT|nr:EAL domain-containing protein [Geomonas limicola]GFO66467.1 two-component system response regulator [Geomonas limicola]